MALGVLYALIAGLLWGLVFVVPLLLPEYPAAMLTVGRYLAFGLIALPLAWLDRARLAQLRRADWLEALRLAAIGNLLYYLCLAAAIQHASGPVPTMIIGTLPVVIAIFANLGAGRSGRLPWARLAPSLALLGAGVACVHQAEWVRLAADPAADLGRYAIGVILALGALACWTWYPIRNAAWLRAHPDRSPRTWATAQGLATLPLAALGAGMLTLAPAIGDPASSGLSLGPQPLRFLAWMLAIGLLASWLGTWCWNQASQRLPTALAGQLIVFETLAALAYVYALRGAAPGPVTLAGIVLLVAGVLVALRRPPAAGASG